MDQHIEQCFSSADAVRQGSNIVPWRGIGVEGGPVTVDLKACREKFCCGGRKSKIRASVDLV